MKVIGELKAILGLDKRKFEEGLKGATTQAKGLGNTFGSIFKSLGFAYGIKELLRFSLETSKLAAKAEGVRTAFERLNQPTLLQDLRKATQNTVSDVQLMTNAIRAANFKLPLDQLATYFEFATRRARETGESVEYMVDSIVLGISRESVKILDNLGISAKEIGEELKTAGNYAEAVGNIIERELGKAGRAADDAGVKFMQFSAAWAGFKETSGDLVNKSGLPNLLQRWSNQMRILGDESLSTGKKIAMIGMTRIDRSVYENYLEWINGLRKAAEGGGYNIVAGAAMKAGLGGFNMLGDLEPQQITTIQTLTDEIASLEEALMSLDIRNTEDIKKTLDQIKAKKDLIDELMGVTEKVKENKRAIQEYNEVWKEMVKPEVAALGQFAYPGVTPKLHGAGGMSQLFADPSKLAETNEALVSSYDGLNSKVLEVSNSISGVFYSVLTADDDIFKTMTEALKRLAAQFAATAMAAAVLALAIQMIPGLGAIAGVSAGSKFGDIFKMLLKGGSGIGMAGGGTIPAGYPNDSFGPVMLSSGETVLTAKQSNWLREGLLVQVTGEISGRNIAINGRRQNYSN